jgi:YHS domain-containing protein
MAIDLVCGMIVDDNLPPAKGFFLGKDYYFCAVHSKEAFEKEPPKYIGRSKEWGEASDPVCGMKVKISEAAAMSVHGGSP